MRLESIPIQIAKYIARFCAQVSSPPLNGLAPWGGKRSKPSNMNLTQTFLAAKVPFAGLMEPIPILRTVIIVLNC